MKIKKYSIESFSDNRAVRYFDLFPELSGQITISKIFPHQFSGWHKHNNQTDHFFVAEGSLKVAIISPKGEIMEELLTSENPKTIVVQPSHWHAWKSSRDKVILIYHLNQKHDESDEFRLTEEEIMKRYEYQI